MLTALADAENSSQPLTIPVTDVMVLRAHKGWQAINIKELWVYRDLLFTLAGRDIKVRYKQTVLGVAWVVLQPLVTAGIFTFVFGMIANLKPDGNVPYIVFSFAGLMGWNIFSGTLSRVNGSLLGNSTLISKIYFPRMVIPLSMLPTTLLDFSVTAGMMVVLMLMKHIAPTTALLLLPVWVVLLLTLALGAGLVTASLAIRYRDINMIVPVVLQLLMYASPVAYPTSKIPPQYQTLYFLNPLSAILDAFRWSILGTGQPQWWALGPATAVSVLLLAAGAMLFKKMEREFADVI